MLSGTIDSQHNYVSALDPNAADRWPMLAAAKADALAVQKLLQESLREFTSEDVDVVVFGSLARQEWTSGSDVDWTLLIDGQANPVHRSTARRIESRLRQLQYKGITLKQPGAEGIFGSMAFSHDIVHHIGGQADSNRNTTQRILLLTEAVALREPGDELGACERTIRQVLNRYLESDSNFHAKADQESRIPRFLLNDVVRYWRTMCVDFAYKDWEQDGKKWALRNVKLRTSRKMLFFSSLLTVFSCFHNDALKPEGAKREEYLLGVQKHLLAFVHSTPLNIVSWTLSQLGFIDECKSLLDHYEQVLRIFDDQKKREHLEKLNQDVYEDNLFLECREISHRLHEALKQVCFDAASPLKEFTLEYGVF